MRARAGALFWGCALACSVWAGPALAEAARCELPAVTTPQGVAALRFCGAIGPAAPVAQFSVEIADTEAERARGLMQRAQMPATHGMLFVYPNPRPVAFWMHDTLIPLDMLFIDAQGMVVRIHENARPLDETPIPSGAPVQFVLEINGGEARARGLVAGMVVPELAVLAQ